jgi:ribosome recycling factor
VAGTYAMCSVLVLQAIEAAVSALRSHTLNLNPIVDGPTIKVPIPKMSKELRESMVKQAKAHAEKAKVGVRKARQKAISDLRREGASEDTTRKLEKHIQQMTEENTESIEEILKAKSKDLLKI